MDMLGRETQRPEEPDDYFFKLNDNESIMKVRRREERREKREKRREKREKRREKREKKKEKREEGTCD